MKERARLAIKRVEAPLVALQQQGAYGVPARKDSAPKRGRAAPIVKWAGGKTRLVGELRSRMPTRFGHYFEPFMGGAALFFNVAPQRATLSDTNPELVSLYGHVRANVEGLMEHLIAHESAHSEEHYYATRESWNAGSPKPGSIERAATFIYLNKTCYNGLWRVNASGGFNVPMGRYAKPSILQPQALRDASQILSGAKVSLGHYRTVADQAERGDFVYFDPPYVPVSKTSDFVAYTADGFSEHDQEELADCFSTLAGRGVHVMLTNSDAPIVRKLYKSHRIEKVMCARAINSRASARGQVAELLVTSR